MQPWLTFFLFTEAATINALQLHHVNREGIGHAISRRFVLGCSSSAFLHASGVWAASKYDKAFDECLSKCVYEETKITKGIGKVEVKTRSDSFAVCKPKVQE